MSTRKHNDYLDAPSDSDDAALSGYDSEAHEQSRGRAAKRRKLSPTPTSDANSAGEDNVDEPAPDAAHDAADRPPSPTLSTHPQQNEHTNEHASFHGTRTLARTPRTLAPSTQLDPHIPPPHAKPGILYLSRIPPYLKPSSLRSLLAPYAPRHGLARLFLTPEPASARKSRIRLGGNKKKSFTEGWVEFISKKEAKVAGEGLNGREIGGRGWYGSDVWCVRYLRGFRWGDLVEGGAGERREWEGRMRVEVAQSARDGKDYLRALEGARVGRTRERRERRRGGGVGDGEGGGDGGGGDDGADTVGVGGGGMADHGGVAGEANGRREERKMVFKQRRVRDKETRHRGGNGERVERGGGGGVLKAIF